MKKVKIWILVTVLTAGLAMCGSEPENQEKPQRFQVTKQEGSLKPYDVGMDESGRFFVVWYAEKPDRPGLYARLFDASRQPLTEEFFVSSAGRKTDYASVDMWPEGGAVVAFRVDAASGVGFDAHLRIFDPSGQPLGEDIVLFHESQEPSVEILENGEIVAASAVKRPDSDGAGSSTRVLVKKLRRDGVLLGDPIEIFPIASRNIPHLVQISKAQGQGFTVAWSETIEVHYVGYPDPVRIDFSLMRPFPQPPDWIVFGNNPTGSESYCHRDNGDDWLFGPTENRFIDLHDGRFAVLGTFRNARSPDTLEQARERAQVQICQAGWPRGEEYDSGALLELSAAPPTDALIGQDIVDYGCGRPAGCRLAVTWTRLFGEAGREPEVQARLFDFAGRPIPNPIDGTMQGFTLGRLSRYPSGAYPYAAGNSEGALLFLWRSDVQSEPGVESLEALHLPISD